MSIYHRSKIRTKYALRKRDGDTCYICGERVNLCLNDRHDPKYASIDHVLPISLGGKDNLSNLKLVHQRCNNERDKIFGEL